MQSAQFEKGEKIRYYFYVLHVVQQRFGCSSDTISNEN